MANTNRAFCTARLAFRPLVAAQSDRACMDTPCINAIPIRSGVYLRYEGPVRKRIANANANAIITVIQSRFTGLGSLL